MNNQNSQVNPQLRDVLATALQQDAPKARPPDHPQIVVHGSGNVFSWGGPVYVQKSPHRPERSKP